MITTRTGRKNLLVTAAVLSLAALAGCSSSGSSSTSNAAANAGAGSGAVPTSSTATGQPIKVGMVSPLDAPFYSAPDEYAVVKAALATINGAGGIKGRPLVLDFCNDGNDPNTAVACARQMVTDGVVATLASITVEANDQVTQILSQAGIPNIAYNALSPDELNDTNNFVFDGGSAWEYGALGGVIQQLGLKKVIMVRANIPGTVSIAQLAQEATQKAGGKFLGSVLLPSTAIADFSSYAEQVIKSGADLVAIPDTDTDASGIIQAVRQLGSNVQFVTNTGSFGSEQNIQQLGSLANGIIDIGPTPWINDSGFPGMSKFVAAMKAEQARGDSGADLATVRPLSDLGWVGAYALAQVLDGMAAAGTPINHTTVLKAFGAATDLSTGGLTGFTWTPSVHQTVLPGNNAVTNIYEYIEVVKNGKLVLQSSTPVNVGKYL